MPKSLSLFVLSTLAASACASNDASDPDLEGSAWTLDAYIDSGSVESIDLELPPTIQFDGAGTILIFDACNTGFGGYESDGSTLTFTAIGTTYLACEDEMINEAGAEFYGVVSEGESTYVVSDDQLTLMRGSKGLSASRE